MAARNPADRIKYVEEFAAAISGGATDEGAGTKADGFAYVLMVGTTVTGSLSFQMQNSETQGGSYTDITGAVAVAAAGAQVVGSVDLNYSLAEGATPPGTGKPWIRCQATATGASSGAATLIFMGPVRDNTRAAYAPTAFDFAVGVDATP